MRSAASWSRWYGPQGSRAVLSCTARAAISRNKCRARCCGGGWLSLLDAASCLLRGVVRGTPTCGCCCDTSSSVGMDEAGDTAATAASSILAIQIVPCYQHFNSSLERRRQAMMRDKVLCSLLLAVSVSYISRSLGTYTISGIGHTVFSLDQDLNVGWKLASQKYVCTY